MARQVYSALNLDMRWAFIHEHQSPGVAIPWDKEKSLRILCTATQ
jgi:hypothetical protein